MTAPALPEGPDYYGEAYKRNAPFAQPSTTNYQTPLNPQQELMFRQWVSANGVPFDPNAKIVDYDMRGYWLDAGGKPDWAGGATHFPDTYKTPYDTTFSAESKYATPNAPFMWRGDTLIDTRSGDPVIYPRYQRMVTPPFAPPDMPTRAPRTAEDLVGNAAAGRRADMAGFEAWANRNGYKGVTWVRGDRMDAEQWAANTNRQIHWHE